MGLHRALPLAATSPTRHDVYLVLVVLHAVVALAAFGAMALTGVYGSTATRLGRAGAAEEVRRYFARPPLAEALVLAVAALGVAALATDPHGGGFAHLWVTLALMLWVVASVLWIRVVHPAELALRALSGGAGDRPERAELDDDARGQWSRHGRRLVWASAVTDVIFVVALGLMVFRPA